MATTQQLKRNIDWRYIDAVGITMHDRCEPKGKYLSADQRQKHSSFKRTEIEKTAVGHVYLIKDANPECPNVTSKGAYEVDGVQYGLVIMLGRNRNNGSYEYDSNTPSNEYGVADPKLAWIAKVYGNQDAQKAVEIYNAPAQQAYCAHMIDGAERKMFSSHHIEECLIDGAIAALGDQMPSFLKGARFDDSFNLEQ